MIIPVLTLNMLAVNCLASGGTGRPWVDPGSNKMMVFVFAVVILQSAALLYSGVYIWKKRKRVRNERRNAALFKDIFELAPYSCVLNSTDGRYLKVNRSYCDRMGFEPQDVIGKTMAEMGITADEHSVNAIRRQLLEKGEVSNVEIELTHTNGEVIHSLFSSRLIEYNGENVFLSMTVDISERKTAERLLVERELKLMVQNERLQNLLKNGTLFLQDFIGAVQEITLTGSQLLETSRVSVWIYSDDYQMIRCIDLYDRVSCLHSSGEELHSSHFPSYTDAHRQGSAITVSDVFNDPRTQDIPMDYLKIHDIKSLLDVPIWLGDRVRGILSFESTGDERVWTVEDERIAHTLATFVTLGFEIEERKRSEEQRENLQSQLLQSQKMEAVGRLAGGVAHDFNNMLTVIIGHSEIAGMSNHVTDELAADLEAIKNAARRSADLTGQLLAFARKQTIDPRVLDLNLTVAGMISMLRRLIGEDIDLAWMPGDNLWPVCMDPSQIDQILVNLCVNARDAIHGVGKVVIETLNVVFDKMYCENHLGFIEGSYVMLAVSDDGCGMSKEHLAHIFEPFFTTKDKGKGTGLGLATLYGIVKQNSGFLNAYSEPGKGTTLRIYLPRSMETVTEPLASESSINLSGRGEVVLMVEDEPVILSMGKIMLEKLNYKVLAAGSPSEALEIADEHAHHIDLLMTDVVMPEMNGKELADKITSLNPSIRCLYVSGYTANAIVHRGVLDKGVHFIQKPFSIRTLSIKIRRILEPEPES